MLNNSALDTRDPQPGIILLEVGLLDLNYPSSHVSSSFSPSFCISFSVSTCVPLSFCIILMIMSLYLLYSLSLVRLGAVSLISYRPTPGLLSLRVSSRRPIITVIFFILSLHVCRQRSLVGSLPKAPQRSLTIGPYGNTEIQARW